MYSVLKNIGLLVNILKLGNGEGIYTSHTNVNILYCSQNMKFGNGKGIYTSHTNANILYCSQNMKAVNSLVVRSKHIYFENVIQLSGIKTELSR